MEERCPNPGDVGAQTLPAPQLSASTIVLFPCWGIIPLRSRGIGASQPTSFGQQDSIITVGTKGPVSSSPHHCPLQHGHSLSVDPAAPQPYWHPMGGGKELSSVPPSLPVSPQQGSPPPLHPNNPPLPTQPCSSAPSVAQRYPSATTTSSSPTALTHHHALLMPTAILFLTSNPISLSWPHYPVLSRPYPLPHPHPCSLSSSYHSTPTSPSRRGPSARPHSHVGGAVGSQQQGAEAAHGEGLPASQRVGRGAAAVRGAGGKNGGSRGQQQRSQAQPEPGGQHRDPGPLRDRRPRTSPPHRSARARRVKSGAQSGLLGRGQRLPRPDPARSPAPCGGTGRVRDGSSDRRWGGRSETRPALCPHPACNARTPHPAHTLLSPCPQCPHHPRPRPAPAAPEPPFARGGGHLPLPSPPRTQGRQEHPLPHHSP